MKLSAAITHQVQILDNSCALTCLAMLAGIESEELIDAGMHDRVFDNPVGCLPVMDELGIVAVPMSPLAHASYWGELYLIRVPSLNNPGGAHAIILDLTGMDAKIWDPQMGNPGMRYYVPRGAIESQMLEPLATELADFTFDFRVLECPVWQ